MRALLPVSFCLLVAILSDCSGKAPPAPTSPKPAGSSSASASASAPLPPAGRAAFVSPSILLPDIAPDAPGTGFEPDGSRRAIVAQMRIIEHPDGSLERAAALLPASHSRMLSVELPSRLGGGFAFVASADSSAQVWRAASWLSALEPIASTSQPVYEVIPGFDRLYLRHAQNAPLYGIDLEKGEYTDFSRLPVPLRLGPAFFADPWRAVVVTDLRGPLATFDAGITWYPLGIRSAVQKVDALGDRIRITARDDAWLLSPDGVLTTMGGAPTATATATATAMGAAPATTSTTPATLLTSPKPDARQPQPLDRPLGARPLRLALERGMPIDSNRAVVAHGGNLAIIDLKAGTIAELHRNAYPHSYTECNAIALGAGVGFVCGEQNGATTIFRLDRPSRMTPVAQWPVPRAIFPSGNGALVARAPCPGSTPAEGLSQYCVRNVQGLTRELRFKGDVGAERVVALSDGSIAILIAPRPGAEGRLVILKGEKSLAFVLDFQNVPRPVVEMARRGLWMNGVQELSPGVLGVWVEAGGPIVGLRIDDKGKVTSGPVQKTASDTGDTIVSGRFGLVWKSIGHGMETTDGGMTWKELDLPLTPLRALPERRACSAVGCVIGGWLRVGWGPTRNDKDLEPPRKPPLRYIPQRSAKPMTLNCDPTGRLSPPPATVPAPPQPQAAARPPVRYGYGPGGHVAVAHAGYGAWQAARWLPFGPLPAPVLGADEEGLSTSGRDYGESRTSYRIYVWGPKSADWTRAGHWLIRFDDPFDTPSFPRSTLPAVSPWPDISSASATLNSGPDRSWFDAEMRSGVMGWCQGPRQCKHFGITPQELPVPFTTNDPAGLPEILSAIRSEDSWYMLSSGTQQEIELWVVNLSGMARKLRTFPRVEHGSQVSLVRRARSAGLALLTISSLAQRSGAEWIALPLDTSTGQVLDAIRLGPTDFDGIVPPACARDQDGWQFDSQPGSVPQLNLPGKPYVSEVRARLRADPGRICVAGLTGRVRRPEGTEPWPPRTAGAPAAATPSPGVLLSAWEGDQGRKIEFSCHAP
ncbi:MAG: hypothetical protein HY898_34070 [Deltaproteobacteria bacterium]|nr:hypothetical protein [Deltaproteobacteria bacterium]